ncbi:MAG: nuclear transport factor 2 family protein [Gammaproteobacteria bacterium]|nr:nuclear transport factor 2 family protein [Gammaproteobacteria bacterium]
MESEISAAEKLAIERACERVVLDAVHGNDSRDYKLLAAMFTTDGTLHRPSGPPLIGREAIEASYLQRPADRITRHLVTNIRVEITSPSTTHVLSYALVYAASTARPAEGNFGLPAETRHLVGEFEDEMVFTDEGWRIRERHARFVMHFAG